MKIEYKKQNIILSEIECFSLSLSLDCGQAFRWSRSGEMWHGVAGDKALNISQQDGKLILYNTDKKDLPFWIDYFDLETDYSRIVEDLMSDDALNTACREYYGIRILRQEPWETLCSFIISANNNIPRIKGIIERLCTLYGKTISEDVYAFPSAMNLMNLTPEDLAPIRAGFRAKYIIDAARKVAGGEVMLGELNALSYESAKQELLKVKGVGDKVADCVLLYGYNRFEAFPKDVWVKRIMAETYPDGLPECVCGNEGIAQQYLFHWRRNS